jgi:hypothetical protein
MIFYLTNGFLKSAIERGFLFNNTLKNSPDKNAIIKLRYNNYPVLVRVDKIEYHNKENIVVLTLFDGETSLEVILDSCKWNMLNIPTCSTIADNNHKIEKGSVILIYDYTFSDVNLNNHGIIDMFTLVNVALIGTYENEMDTCETITTSVNVEKLNDGEKNISGKKIITISEINLNLNNQNWSVKLKLLKISMVKDFINKLSGVNGKFIRLQFGDRTGITEVVGFNDEVERLSCLVENSFYILSNADIKASKSTLQAWEDTGCQTNELYMTKKTIIEQYSEKDQYFKIFTKPAEKETPAPIDRKSSKYCSLNELVVKKDNDIVTVIGIITLVEEMREITPKNKNPLNLRNFFITSIEKVTIKVAIWGKQAEEFSFKAGNIIILSEVKVTNFGGVTLNIMWKSGIMKIENDWTHIEEANKLRSWWETENLSGSLKRKLSFDP